MLITRSMLTSQIGPPDQVSSMDKRDGSSWELFDCLPGKLEKRQTARAICLDDSEESNCKDIHLGEHGVPGTIVEMPPGVCPFHRLCTKC